MSSKTRAAVGRTADSTDTVLPPAMVQFGGQTGDKPVPIARHRRAADHGIVCICDRYGNRPRAL